MYQGDNREGTDGERFPELDRMNYPPELPDQKSRTDKPVTAESECCQMQSSQKEAKVQLSRPRFFRHFFYGAQSVNGIPSEAS